MVIGFPIITTMKLVCIAKKTTVSDSDVCKPQQLSCTYFILVRGNDRSIFLELNI